MSKTNIKPFGKYLLLEKLAIGGMAEVFLAKASGAHGIGKFIAIKRILPQYSSNEAFIKMFTDEAKICVNLSHSNIAKIYEFGVERGQFYIVMELIEGKNLRQVLARLGKENRQGFSVDQAVYMAKEIASGLDNAHRCLEDSTGKPLNIIHRDMSPQNVMVSFEGEIKVVDFGIAKAEGDKEETKAGTLKGKFSYMSPEQASGEPIDLRTDVYSLGILLWELLANKRLFASSNEMNTLKKVRDSKVPSISKINPKVPEELERIVNISLAKDPSNRYQTCAEFYKDLNRFLNRFFPDFSSHEFSVFVKSLYADEVLANRKKLIEYSKLSKEYTFESNDKEEKTVVGDVESNEFFGPELKNTQVTFNKDSLQISRPKTQSRIQPIQKKSNLLSLANLSVVGLFMVAIGLIASQVFTSSTDAPITYTEQASLEENTFANSIDKHNLVVTSNPRGAEIYIDNKNSGLLTPGRVSVPANKEFKITLRKDGYLSYRTNMTSRGNGSKEDFTLQKINLGYIDIRTVYRNNIVYINDKRLRETVPILDYRVPAGKKIKVKIVNKASSKSVTKYVVVKPDQKVKLNIKSL